MVVLYDVVACDGVDWCDVMGFCVVSCRVVWCGLVACSVMWFGGM